MSRPDVVVIGAGFAGLSAAVRLVERGARVLVVEGRRRLGGRATAFADPQTGELVDNGQHAFFGCYTETFAFLRAIGAEADVAVDEHLDIEIVDASGQRSRLCTAPLPPPLHLVVGLLRWSPLDARDRLAALQAGMALRRIAAAERRGSGLDARLDALTVDDWLVQLGQTERLRALLWEPLAVAALNQWPSQAAAAPFARVLARMFAGSRRDGAIGLSRKPLDALYAEPARQYLVARGSELRAGATARLVVQDGRASGVALGGDHLAAGVVISSVPWYAMSALVEGIPALSDVAQHASAMRASPIVTVNLWYDRPVTDASFIGLPGRTFQWVFDKSRILEERVSHVSLVSSGADAIVGQGNDALIERATADLAAALPAVRAARLVRATAVREHRASFSLAPGQPRRPAARTAVQGFVLAGDWTDTGLPATIEGAVLSGHRAAELVLKQVGAGGWGEP